ncbi:MAG: PEP-CTERM sorting domain-containing protein [Pirellulales bacterium]
MLNDYNLATVERFFTTRTLPIPLDLRDTVDTITFEIVAGGFPVALVDSEVRIDDVRFIPEPSSLILLFVALLAASSATLRSKRRPNMDQPA